MRVAVAVPKLNGGDRPPENVVKLAVPGGDYGIGHRKVGQGKEPGTITDVVDVCSGDVPKDFVPEQYIVSSPELGQVGLFGSAGAAVKGPHVFNLVIGLVYSGLVKAGVGWARNCEGLVRVKGVTEATHGTSIGAFPGGVGRHSPGSGPPKKSGGGGTGKLPSLTRKAMMPAAAIAPMATPASSSSRKWSARY